MNEYQRKLMDKPSVDGECCAICGRYPAERHHIVFRSQGGTDGPTIPLCGFGNNLKDAEGKYYCHGRAHHGMLHFKFEDGGWWYALTNPMKYEAALKHGEWRMVGQQPIRMGAFKMFERYADPPI